MSEDSLDGPREEWALRYPILNNYRILPVEDHGEAMREQTAMASQGVRAQVLFRLIPAWTNCG